MHPSPNTTTPYFMKGTFENALLVARSFSRTNFGVLSKDDQRDLV